MQILMFCSTKGGEGKTSSAVNIAMDCAIQGKKTLIIDLDPSTDSTKWFNLELGDKDFGLIDILGADGTPTKDPDKDPTGWAMQIAKPSGWHENLWVIPSHESAGTFEMNSDPTLELRLKKSLIGADYDVVILDCPNRSGGPLLRSAFLIADTIVYTAVGDDGALEGFSGARRALVNFTQEQSLRGNPAQITEAGIIFCGHKATATPRVQKVVIDELRESGLLLTPLVPERTAVREARMSRRWVGEWEKAGKEVVDAYTELGKQIIK